MHKNKVKHELLIAYVVASLFIFNANAQRKSLEINSNWKFYKGDIVELPVRDVGEWENVTIPHTWNATDILDDTPGYHRGVCFYQKELFIDDSYSDKNVFLHFEAVNEKAWIFVNGKEVGMHEGGYTAFNVEITPHIKVGKKNIINVKVDNRHDETILPIDGDLSHFGGIYRDVWLIATNKVHFDMEFFGSDGVFVRPQLDDDLNGSLEVNGGIKSDFHDKTKAELRLVLKNHKNEIVAEKKKRITLAADNTTKFEEEIDNIQTPSLWSDKAPNLYYLDISLSINEKASDNLTITTGFKTYKLDKSKGLFLNNEQTEIKGMGYSQDYDKLGYAMSNSLLVNDAKLMKEMGVNFLYSLYPLDPSFMDECDKSGILGWLRLPNMSRIAHSPKFKEKTIKMVKEMVYQNYNHPSMLVWGLACEQLGAMDWYWSDPIDTVKANEHMEYSYEFFSELRGMLDELDPDRLKSDDFHTDPTPSFYKKSGLTDIYDFNCWGLYQGWYHFDLDNVSPFIDQMWDYNREIPMMIVYGAGKDERIHTNNPTQFDYSPEYQQIYHNHYQKVLAEKQWVGQFIWLFNDFQREGRGDAIPHVNQKGMVNAKREKTDIYYYFQSLWTEEPMLHLAAKDWNTRMLTNAKNEKVTIKAFSNTETVELICNGKSYGTKTPDFGEVQWEVSLNVGMNNLVVKANKENINLKDETTIHLVSLPEYIESGSLPNDQLCINVGQSRTVFHDPINGDIWLSDKKYETASYGHKTGDYHTTWTYMAAWDGLREGVDRPIKGSVNDPLYQTFLVGVTDYQIDVPEGRYKVELLFAEPFTKENRLKPDQKTGADKNGDRVFSVKVNDEMVKANLNLAEEIGVHQAYNISINAKVLDKGVKIALVPEKGQPVLSGVKLVKLD